MNGILRFVMVLFLAVPASSMRAQENQAEPINLLEGLKPQLTSVESGTNVLQPTAAIMLVAKAANLPPFRQ